MEFVIRVDFGQVVGILSALALFGAGYNQLIALAERRKLLEEQMTETERIRRVAIAINSLQMIARLLEGVGAQTRP